MSDLFPSIPPILALGAFILTVRRATGSKNAPGVSSWLRLLLGAFFVSVAMSVAAATAVLLLAVEGWLLALLGIGLGTGDTALSTAHPWTVTANYLIATVLTALIFHWSMSWYFHLLAGFEYEDRRHSRSNGSV